jgi:hypothetical protein
MMKARSAQNHDVVAECDVFKFENVDFGRRDVEVLHGYAI